MKNIYAHYSTFNQVYSQILLKAFLQFFKQLNNWNSIMQKKQKTNFLILPFFLYNAQLVDMNYRLYFS